jgi:hypothetical protein
MLTQQNKMPDKEASQLKKLEVQHHNAANKTTPLILLTE